MCVRVLSTVAFDPFGGFSCCMVCLIYVGYMLHAYNLIFTSVPTVYSHVYAYMYNIELTLLKLPLPSTHSHTADEKELKGLKRTFYVINSER